MKWPSGSLVMALFLKSILSDMSIATPAFFSCPFAWKICFQPFTFCLCRSFSLRRDSCRQNIVGHVFLYIQLFYVFWLEHLIHLHLRLLLIGTYSLPIFWTYVPLCLSLFLPFLIAAPLASLAELVLWRYILLDFFCLGNFYLTFYVDWEPCWLK